MHLSSNPLELVRKPPYDSFSALMQLDSGWPVEGRREGQRSTDERGQHVNVIPCLPIAAVSPTTISRLRSHGCPCGVVPMPLLNTGFVYVRASPSAASAQQLVYNRSVERILDRLRVKTPESNPKGEANTKPVWSQDVVCEVSATFATLPVGWPASCHLKDLACQRGKRRSGQERIDAKKRWWLPPAASSNWLASHTSNECGYRKSSPRAARDFDSQLVAWTELRPSGNVLPSTPVPTLAALPRAEVGRMCGKRQAVDLRWLAHTSPLPCSAYATLPLRQAVLHMQFTSAETRTHILEAMHWWYIDRDIVAEQSPTPMTPTTCAALAAGAASAALSSAPSSASTMSGVVVSSSMANFSLLCVLPGPREGQRLALGRKEGCPCCWQTGELREKMLGGSTAAGDDPQIAAAALKALNEARKYTGCRIWRRYS